MLKRPFSLLCKMTVGQTFEKDIYIIYVYVCQHYMQQIVDRQRDTKFGTYSYWGF